MDMLSDDILSNVSVEETTDSTLYLLDSKNYRLLLSSSQLMSSLFKKIPDESKTNLVIYPRVESLTDSS